MDSPGAAATEIEAGQEEDRRFTSAFTHASIGMALVSPEGKFLQVNRAFCSLTGYSRQELTSLDFQRLTHPDDLQTDLALVRQLLQGKIDSYQLEKRYLHRAGHWIWGLLSVSLISDAKGYPLYFISQVQDITTRKQLEDERQAHSEAIRALVENAPDIISRFDPQCRTLYVNRAIESIAGRESANYLGKTLIESGMPEPFARGFETNIRAALGSRQSVSQDYQGSDGLRHYHGRFVPEFDGEGQVASVLVIARDITEMQRVNSELQAAERKLKAANAELAAANERLQLLAHHDGLTGLKNRRRFDERLSEAVSRAQRCKFRGEPCEFSLLLLDIDHFKQMNDTFGHAAGDEVLYEVAQVLVQTLRSTDIIARYGGEEFGVLLFETDEQGSRRAAERCRVAVEKRLWKHKAVTVSLGVTTWVGEDAQTLLVRADLALYAAKHAGRNQLRHALDLNSNEA